MSARSTANAAWPQQDGAVHAVGNGAARCGATLTIMPMNFAPVSKFGRGRDKWGREWCAACVALAPAVEATP